MMNTYKGFTLLELMIVVVMITIIVTIAIPSYQAYTKRAITAQVQQEISKISEQLERYKTKSFSYRGFDAKYLYDHSTALSSFKFPSETDAKYIISIADISEASPKTLLHTDQGLGQKWAISAIPLKTNLDALLLTSTGIRCKQNHLIASDLENIKAYKGCHAHADQW